MNISGLDNAGIIRKVKLVKRANSHSSCEIETLLNGNVNPGKYIGAQIVLENDERILMRGEVASVTVNRAFGQSTAVFCAYSLSAAVDREVKNRIYQDCEKSFSDILGMIRCESYNVKVIDKTAANEKIEAPVIQRNETDFEFAKRMALSKGLYLFVDDTSKKFSASICKKLADREKTISAKDVIYFETHITQYEERIKFKSREYFNVGSLLCCEGYDYLITEFVLNYKNQTENYQYEMVRTVKTAPRVRENDFVILGKAEVISGDDPERLGRIQVSFLEYEDNMPNNRMWIPYVNNLTEKDGGMLFIPDPGEIVNVYCCNSECYASGCVRQQQYNGSMSDISARTLLSRGARFDISEKRAGMDIFGYKIEAGENGLEIQKDKVRIIVNEKRILIKNNGASITAEKDAVEVVSDKNLRLKANEINANGQNKVTVKTSAFDIL